MDDVRFATILRTLNGGATRRGMLTALAALAGLHWSEATAKRRGRRKKQARVQTQGSANQPESLEIVTEKVGGPFPGTFEASGGFDDKGTFLVIESESLFKGGQSERLLTTHITYEFSGADGTFGITTQNRITFGATSSTVQGHWRFTGGTGVYAGLRGEGSVEGTIDAIGIFRLRFTGVVQLG
jgi:hypothetical protein